MIKKIFAFICIMGILLCGCSQGDSESSSTSDFESLSSEPYYMEDMQCLYENEVFLNLLDLEIVSVGDKRNLEDTPVLLVSYIITNDTESIIDAKSYQEQHLDVLYNYESGGKGFRPSVANINPSAFPVDFDIFYDKSIKPDTTGTYLSAFKVTDDLETVTLRFIADDVANPLGVETIPLSEITDDDSILMSSPSPTPTPTPQPKPISGSGQGDKVVTEIQINNDVLYSLHLTHSGSSNFAVHQYDTEGNRELLVNEIGSYSGYVLPQGHGPYILEITADGPWEYTFEPLDTVDSTVFSGTGDFVTPIFEIQPGVWELSHDGNSNFAVRIYSAEGRDLLANEIGAYSGEKLITESGVGFFEIVADGNWEIKLKE